MGKIKIGLIGYGYWGPNLARLIQESETAELKYCADLVENSLKQVKQRYPQIITTKDYFDILNDKEIDAVLVVTPTRSHFKIAVDVLNAKKHLFVEKPLTYSYAEAEKIVSLAKKNNVKLAVGHVFLYNPAVRFIKKMIDGEELGTIRHLHFQRRNLGPIRKDVNVMWDLAPHDISMMLYFLQEKPVSVIAVGQSYLQKGIPDVVSASIRFENDIIANIILSWIDPIKIRDITVVGSKKMLLFDDVNPSEKIKIFDKNANIIKDTTGVTFGEYQIALHAGDIYIPSVENKEPLKEEINHFIEAVTSDQTLINDGSNGARVVKVLESLQKSLDNSSQLVVI